MSFKKNEKRKQKHTLTTGNNSALDRGIITTKFPLKKNTCGKVREIKQKQIFVVDLRFKNKTGCKSSYYKIRFVIFLYMNNPNITYSIEYTYTVQIIAIL